MASERTLNFILFFEFINRLLLSLSNNDIIPYACISLFSSVKKVPFMKLLSSYRKKYFISVDIRSFKSPISFTNFLILITFLSNSLSQSTNCFGTLINDALYNTE